MQLNEVTITGEHRLSPSIDRGVNTWRVKVAAAGSFVFSGKDDGNSRMVIKKANAAFFYRPLPIRSSSTRNTTRGTREGSCLTHTPPLFAPLFQSPVWSDRWVSGLIYSDLPASRTASFHLTGFTWISLSFGSKRINETKCSFSPRGYRTQAGSATRYFSIEKLPLIRDNPMPSYYVIYNTSFRRNCKLGCTGQMRINRNRDEQCYSQARDWSILF